MNSKYVLHIVCIAYIAIRRKIRVCIKPETFQIE
jgi:hypothetical protein